MSLQEVAKNLGIEFDDAIEEVDLQKLIDVKQKELDSDIDHWKAQATKWETEAKTAFAKRDLLKADKTKLGKQIKKLEANMKDMIPSDEKDKLTKELNELKTFKSEIDKKTEEEELAQKTEVERLQLDLKKQKDTFQTQLDEKFDEIMKESKAKDKQLEENSQEIESLRLNGLEAEIVREAAKLDAWSPSQIFLLTKDIFTFDKNLGKFSFLKRDAAGKLEDEMTVAEYLKGFLGEEENENLIKSKVNTSSFHTDKDKTKQKTSDNLGNYNPKDPDIIKKAELNSMTPERYIRVVMIPRDKHKKRGQKEE